MTTASQLKPLIEKKKKPISRTLIIYAIMLPGIIYILINNILPLYGITIAFRKVSFTIGPLSSPFYGVGKLKDYNFFYNFELLFKSDIIGSLIRNTLLYNFAFIVIDIVVPVTVAILFNTIENKISKKIFQTLILLPNIISWVIISYIGYAFLSEESGVLSHLFGINDFYHNPSYWPFILTFFHVWKGVGMGMIIYVAALVGIDQEMYEAAKIDGAGWLRRTFKITIPQLKKMIITMFILSLSKIMTTDFGLFYQMPMNVGALYDVTQTLDVYVYNTLMGSDPNIALSSAVSVFQSIIGFSLVVGANLVIKKIDKESALF